MKEDGLLERNHLVGAEGDAINAILCAAGHNMRLLARWLRGILLRIWMIALATRAAARGPAAVYCQPEDSLSLRAA